MTLSKPRPMTAREWSLLLALSLVWGGSFFFAKIAVAEIPPLTLVLARVGLAAAALHLALRASGVRFPVEARTLRALLVMGALNNAVPFTLIFWGQQEIASGLASILNATTPLWIVLLAHLLVPGERLTPARIGGVAAGLAGVVVLIGPEALAGLGSALAAQLAVLGAALSYAFAGLWGRRFRALPPLATAAGQLTASTLIMAPLALLLDRPWTLAAPQLGTVAAVLALALVSTAFAYLLFFRLLSSAGATSASLVTLLIPVSAVLLGALLLGERLGPEAALGMALIALGLALIDGRLGAWAARRLPTGGT